MFNKSSVAMGIKMVDMIDSMVNNLDDMTVRTFDRPPLSMHQMFNSQKSQATVAGGAQEDGGPRTNPPQEFCTCARAHASF